MLGERGVLQLCPLTGWVRTVDNLASRGGLRMGRIRRKLVEEVIEAVDNHRLVILEGPVGSGKSRVLSSVASEATHGAVRRIFPDRDASEIHYGAVAHLLPDTARAHSYLVELARKLGSLLIIVDDFKHLDEDSVQLLLWGVQNAPITLLVACTDIDAVPTLAEAKFDSSVFHLELPALDFKQIQDLLEELWDRPAKTWEVVATARFAGSNLAAVSSFAGFVQENFPDASGPEAWHEHLQEPGKYSHTALYRHTRSLAENHETEIFEALQILAVAGPCSMPQAMKWVSPRILRQMVARGLITQQESSAVLQLANGLLDLSLRLSIDPELAREIYDSRVSPVALNRSLYPTPELIVWWQSLGINPPRQLILAGARSALLAAQPASVLLLLKDDTSHAAAWLAAEAHILMGNSAGVISNLERALSHPDGPDQLGSSEALVCLAAGYWPKYADRFTQIKGLEAAANGVWLSSVGDYEKCIALAEKLARNTGEQMWQNVQVFAALGEVMTGNSRDALQRISTLGPVATDASSITAHNVAEAKQVVQFLAGAWTGLLATNTGEYGLHALVDRSGLSTDIGRMLGEPSGSTASPINYEAPAPFGYVRIRELARIVADNDPKQALLELQAYNHAHMEGLPKAIRLLSVGWELKLLIETGHRPDDAFLDGLWEKTQKCDGTLAQLLGMLANGLREDSWTKLEAVQSLAERQGLGSWMPETGSGTAVRSSLLSPREREIAYLAADSISSAEISLNLDLSVRTVDKHLGNIYKKLGIAGREGLGSVLGRPVGIR